ncbi:interleukin-27 receptor subunit alpha-like [Rhinatrema bivittatum]|uniref:interleukin-27 receptor subunit alpha-like n=1 Tax=Rhinatrema bivittatum TaxID=194408 RepID=UPI00112E2EFA|nr:interleukin-27 receptor subunit alpha-like [Rhinatrema bivittatum]
MEKLEKLVPPVLSVDVEPSADSSGVTVSWTISESQHQPPPRFQLRYRERGTWSWMQVSEEDMEPHSYEFSHLEAFTEYEVQMRCVPGDGQGLECAWSQPTVFRSPAAAPTGLVDLWWHTDERRPNLTVLWKALEPKAARSHNLTYIVSYRERGKDGSRSIQVPCCNASLSRSVEYISIVAANAMGRTQAANISLERSDFPVPEGVQAKGSHDGLHVSWIPGRRLSQGVQAYVVQWSEAASRGAATRGWKRLAPASRSALLSDDFQPQVPYIVSVYGLYPYGYGGPVSTLCYIQDGVPSVGPNITVRDVSSTGALVTWEAIPLLQQRGFITHYTVYTSSSSSPQAVRSQNVSVGGNSTFLHLYPSTNYLLEMSASTSAGEGGKSRTTFTTPGAVLLPVVLAPLTVVLAIFCVLGLLFHQRILILGRWILPEWCWQSIPDPMHSKIALQSQNKGVDGSRSSFLLGLDVSDPPLTEVEESPAPAPPPVSSLLGNRRGSLGSLGQAALAPSSTGAQPAAQALIISGYEKHFMPSPEDLDQGRV